MGDGNFAWLIDEQTEVRIDTAAYRVALLLRNKITS